MIHIDGKALRGSYKDASKTDMIHLVSAFASEARLVLAQVKVNEKSNEITAIPELLDLLILKGAIVTIDAMGTQTGIAEKIIEKGGDYVLALKGNQSGLLADVVLSFDQLTEEQHTVHQSVESGHGRIEQRVCHATSDLSLLKKAGEWKGLKSIVKITSRVQIKEVKNDKKGKTKNIESIETRYFISSLPADAAKLAKIIRAHWQIETGLHWILDVAFNEDQNRVRTENATETMGIIRHIAYNLVKQEKSCKLGVKSKLKLAGWSDEYLRKILETKD